MAQTAPPPRGHTSAPSGCGVAAVLSAVLRPPPARARDRSSLLLLALSCSRLLRCTTRDLSSRLLPNLAAPPSLIPPRQSGVGGSGVAVKSTSGSDVFPEGGQANALRAIYVLYSFIQKLHIILSYIYIILLRKPLLPPHRRHAPSADQHHTTHATPRHATLKYKIVVFALEVLHM